MTVYNPSFEKMIEKSDYMREDYIRTKNEKSQNFESWDYIRPDYIRTKKNPKILNVGIIYGRIIYAGIIYALPCNYNFLATRQSRTGTVISVTGVKNEIWHPAGQMTILASAIGFSDVFYVPVQKIIKFWPTSTLIAINGVKIAIWHPSGQMKILIPQSDTLIFFMSLNPKL